MRAVKYLTGLAFLYVVSCAAIVYGYYNDMLGFSISVSLVIQELPIFTSATFITVSCPIALVVAFRMFADKYEDFSIFGLAVGSVLPFLLWFSLLPMSGDQPDPLMDDHFMAMYMLLWWSFYGVYHWLHLDFWQFAKRET